MAPGLRIGLATEGIDYHHREAHVLPQGGSDHEEIPEDQTSGGQGSAEAKVRLSLRFAEG